MTRKILAEALDLARYSVEREGRAKNDHAQADERQSSNRVRFHFRRTRFFETEWGMGQRRGIWRHKGQN